LEQKTVHFLLSAYAGLLFIFSLFFLYYFFNAFWPLNGSFREVLMNGWIMKLGGLLLLIFSLALFYVRKSWFYWVSVILSLAIALFSWYLSFALTVVENDAPRAFDLTSPFFFFAVLIAVGALLFTLKDIKALFEAQPSNTQQSAKA
jgi:hypothetical protein